MLMILTRHDRSSTSACDQGAEIPPDDGVGTSYSVYDFDDPAADAQNQGGGGALERILLSTVGV